MKAREFDAKFEARDDLTEHLDFSRHIGSTRRFAGSLLIFHLGSLRGS